MSEFVISSSVNISRVAEVWYIEYNKTYFRTSEIVISFIKHFYEPNSIDKVISILYPNEFLNEEAKKSVYSFMQELYRLGIVRKSTEEDISVLKKVFAINSTYDNYKFLDIISLDNPYVQVYKVYNLTKEVYSVLKLFSFPKNYIEKNERLNLPSKFFFQEFNIMREIFFHKNICKLLFFGYINDYPYAELEYINGKTLSNFILEDTVPFEIKRKLAEQILSAMSHIHKHDIIHGDIHTRNFLVTTDYHVKMIDFGFSYRINETNHMATNVGLPHYTPPERVNLHSYKYSNKYSTKRSEVFQIGLILYEIFTKTNPFLLNEEIIWKEMAITILNYKLEEDICTDSLVNSVIKRALSNNPYDRFANCEEMAIAFGINV